MTRRTDSYLPVPGEEKNLDLDFISKAKSGESMVRNCVLVIFRKMQWCKRSIGFFFFFFLFPIYLCLRKSLQCSLNPPQRMFSILDLDVSVNIHCCVVHYFPLYPNLFNYVLGIQSNRCTHVLTFGNLNKMTQQAFSLKCIMYRYWSV